LFVCRYEAAAKLQGKGIEMFSIGVGNFYSPEVEAMASVPRDRHLFELENGDSLKKIAGALSYDVCELSAPFPVGTVVRVGVDKGDTRFLHAKCADMAAKVVVQSSDKKGKTMLHISASETNPSQLRNDGSLGLDVPDKLLHLNRANDNGVLGEVNVAVEGDPAQDGNVAEVVVYQEVFAEFLRSVSVPENVPALSDVSTPPTMSDIPGFAPDWEYALDPASAQEGTFSVDEATGQLRTTMTLNRESTPRYLVKVWAFDKNVECVRGYQLVDVSVASVGDQRPVFKQSKYIVDWQEDTRAPPGRRRRDVGDEVVTVAATGPDGSDVACITYGIENGNDEALFSINKDTGLITQANPINYEAMNNHHISLEVTASDCNGGVSDPAFVDITITDSDEVPYFDDDTADVEDIIVKKNQPVGELEVLMVVDDAAQDVFTCTVTVSDGADAYFGVTADDDSCALSTRQSLAPIVGMTVTLVVRLVLDDGTIVDAVTRTVEVNDNNAAPAFAQDAFTVSIAQREPIGSTVLAAAVSDPDGDDVVCSIASGNTGAAFTIEATALGCLVTMATMPSAALSEYFLRLEVTDKNSDPVFATLTITVEARCPLVGDACTVDHACATSANGYTADKCNPDDPVGKECAKNIDCGASGLCRTVNGSSNTYVCDCAAGVFGTTCRETRDNCDPSGACGADETCAGNCQHSGSCVASTTGGKCVCLDLFYGSTCQDEYLGQNPCDVATCPAGSQCVAAAEVENGPPITFTCVCTGRKCKPEPDPCLSSPCRNGATCLSQGADTWACTCPVDCVGSTDCSTCDYKCDPEEKCDPTAGGECAGHCENGGVCVSDVFRGTCDCPRTFYGAKCEQLDDISGPNDPCATVKCGKGAVCEAQQSTHSGPYDTAVCVCPDDAKCKSACDSSPCLNGGVCQPGDANSFTCVCPPGCGGATCDQCRYTCDAANVCPTAPSKKACAGDCENGGICAASPEGGQCACPIGTYGALCTLTDVSVDACASGPCVHGACTRVSTVPTGPKDWYTCICDIGWFGTNCTEKKTSGDPCNPNPCANEGVCKRNGQDATCDCKTGFRGDKCTLSAEMCIDQKALKPCKNGGICVADTQGGHCTCVSSGADSCFAGELCDEVVQTACTSNNDRCAAGGTLTCLNGGTCVASADGGSCECVSNTFGCYSGDDCGQFFPVEQCGADGDASAAANGATGGNGECGYFADVFLGAPSLLPLARLATGA